MVKAISHCRNHICHWTSVTAGTVTHHPSRVVVWAMVKAHVLVAVEFWIESGRCCMLQFKFHSCSDWNSLSGPALSWVGVVERRS